MKTKIQNLFLALALLAASTSARADTVYVSDASNNRIEKFDAATGADLGKFANADAPYGLAFDSAGNLYVNMAGAGIIEKFSPSGTDLGHFASTTNAGVNDLAFDSAGNLYASFAFKGTIEKFTPDGTGSLFSSTGSGEVSGLAFDSAGNLYAASINSARIEKITPDGGGSVFTNTVSNGAGLAFDSAGNLYAAENNTIQKFTPDGVESVFANTGLSSPYGLAFDSVGNLYVANDGNNTIEKFSATGTDLGAFVSTGLNLPTYIAIRVSPPIITVPATIAVEATSASGAVVSFSTSATNFAGGTVATTNTPASGSTFPLGTNTVTVTATSAGSSATNTFLVIVQDTTPPVINLLGANPLTNFINAPFVDPGATATDIYAGNLTGAIQVSGTVNTNVVGSYTLTYSVADINGNSAATNRTVVIILPPPTVIIAPTGNQSVLFWPTSGTNYVLQSTTNLASPNWVTASDAVPVIAFTVTNATPVRFFRLQSQ